MEINTFKQALEFYSFAKMMKDDLPDGQYEEIREIVTEHVELYGKKTSEWPEEAKESFIEEMRENMLYWL